MAVSLINRNTSLRSGGSTNRTPVGYCHDLIITVLSNGTIDPKEIILGNKGDINITRLTFNVSDLITEHVLEPTTDYVLKMIVFNHELPYSDSNPRSYIINTDQWVVPDEIFEISNRYDCILSLMERTAGHTTPDSGSWMSDQFVCIVNDTRWAEDVAIALQTPIVYEDTPGYLMKPAIELSFSADHYNISAQDKSFGNKKDVFVKRLELTDNPLDEGFVYKYGVFISEDEIFIVRFNDIGLEQYACLIPKEITTSAGTYDYFIVAMTEDVINNPSVEDDGFKRWISNSLQFSVTESFLDSTMQLATPAYVLISGTEITFNMVEHAERYECVVDGTSIGAKNLTQDLYFVSNGDGTCYLSQVGDTVDAVVNIPSISPDGDTVTKIGHYAFHGLPITDVTIPHTVTHIDYHAFSDCIYLTHITIPNSVTHIVYDAFHGCTGLENIIFEDGIRLQQISQLAFYGCTSLQKIIIPYGTSRINRQTFYGCSGLANITIMCNTPPILEGQVFDNTDNCPIYVPYSADHSILNTYKTTANWSSYASRIQEIPSFSFTSNGDGTCYVSGIGTITDTNLEIPGVISTGDIVTAIGQDAFHNNTSIQSVVIPNTVTEIRQDAFAGCSQLANISLGDSIRTIGIAAFTYCPIQSIILPTTLETIGNQAFAYCRSLTSIVIPNSVTTLGSSVFYECTSLSALTLSNNIKRIKAEAFFNCTSLTAIIFPDSVEKIEYLACWNCSALRKIEIGTGIGNNVPLSEPGISSSAFGYCSDLTVVMHKLAPPTIADNIFNQTTDYSVYVPAPSLTAYQGATNWSDFSAVIFASPQLQFTSYNNGTCYVSGIGTITDLNIVIPSTSPDGDTVVAIGQNAFADNRNIQSVVIPNTVTTIYGYAFYYCDHLTSLTIPDSVTSIGTYALCNCTGLTELKLSNNLTEITESSIQNCNHLTSLIIPANITTLARRALSSCSRLTKMTFLSNNPPTLVNDSVFLNTNCQFRVPVESLEQYHKAPIWSSYIGRIYPSQIAFDLSTIRDWSTIASGTHQLQLRAKSHNYLSSDLSPAVEFEVTE